TGCHVYTPFRGRVIGHGDDLGARDAQRMATIDDHVVAFEAEHHETRGGKATPGPLGVLTPTHPYVPRRIERELGASAGLGDTRPRHAQRRSAGGASDDCAQ